MKYTTVFFDLFFTLITPDYLTGRNENDVLAISRKEWETYAEEDSIYYERTVGNERDEMCIIKKMTEAMPIKVTRKKQEEILSLRRDERQFKTVPFCRRWRVS